MSDLREIVTLLQKLDVDAAALLLAISHSSQRGSIMPAPLHRAMLALADLRHVLGAGTLADLSAMAPPAPALQPQQPEAEADLAIRYSPESGAELVTARPVKAAKRR
jgi:hypothetical protein